MAALTPTAIARSLTMAQVAALANVQAHGPVRVVGKVMRRGVVHALSARGLLEWTDWEGSHMTHARITMLGLQVLIAARVLIGARAVA